MTFVEATQSWRKFTKWNSAGYTVEVVDGAPLFLPATPLKYLRRLRLHNELFGDRIHLAGLQIRGHDLRLVIEQPHIVGAPPDWEEMDGLLKTQHGCSRLDVPPMGHYKSYSYMRGHVGVFDVHPANCVVAQNAVLVPIDFILVEFEGDALGALWSRFV